MKKGKIDELFTPSGCLSEETLFRHTKGLLQAAELRLVDDHVQACELCAFALEGFAIANPDSFADDVDLLNHAFSGKEALQNSGEPERDPVWDRKGNSGGFLFLRKSMKETNEFNLNENGNPKKSPDQNTWVADKNTNHNPKKTFWLRYRNEFIAASLLLLIAIGGRQVYFELKQNQAELAVKSDLIEEDVVILTKKPELREEAGKPELSEIAGKTTEQKTIAPPVVQVDNDLSLNVVEETFDNVVIEETNPSTDTESTTHSYMEEEKNSNEISGKSETNHPKVDPYNEGVVATNKAMKSRSLSQEKAEEEIAEAEIFTVVEESPQFPGGDEERLRFLSENIRYPQEAREASIQGTVYLTFVVEKDGTIGDVRVLRGIGGGCDEEAVSVIRKMPRWLPGKQRGKPVRVQFNMPIKFSMAG